MYEIGNYVRFRLDGQIGELNKQMYYLSQVKNIVYVIIEKSDGIYSVKAIDTSMTRFGGYKYDNVAQRQLQPVDSDIKFKHAKVGQYLQTFGKRQYLIHKIQGYVIYCLASMGQGAQFSMITGKEIRGDDAVQKILEPEELQISVLLHGNITEYDANHVKFKSIKDGLEFIFPKEYFSKQSFWSSGRTDYQFMEQILQSQKSKTIRG